MIYTGKLLRAELYDDHAYPYTNVKAVYSAHVGKHPGRLVVTNAHWYDPGPTPCGNYKVGGTVISQQYDHARNLVWSGDAAPAWSWDMLEDNAVGTIPALIDGVRQDVSGQSSGVKRSTTRTWWGFDAAGKCTIEVTTSNYTLDGIIDRMQALGIVDGVVLDGSGSSQCYDGATRISGDGRTIYSYLLLWFDDGSGVGDDAGGDSSSETPAGGTAKIYLSPSSQPNNTYAAGDTDEQTQCNRVAEAARLALIRCGFDARKGAEGQGYKDNVAESNAWGADLHIPIHTNAGGGAGTVVFVYSLTDARLRYALPIYNAVQALSPGETEYGVRANAGLYEVKNATATCVYVECEFHDRADLAEWIVAHTTELGEAIARGVCEGYGVPYVEPSDASGTPDTPEAPASVFYRVQVGAFNDRDYAEALKDKLIDGGYGNAFVVEVKK